MPTAKKMSQTLAAIAAGVVALVVAESFTAVPVAAMTHWIGPWPAFLIGTVFYTGAAYVLALLTLHAYERFSSGKPSRLATFLAKEQETGRSQFGQRLMQGGSVVGFVAASIVLGPLVTMWMIRYGGRTEGLHRLAAWSSFAFAVVFVALYTGVAVVLFH